MYSSLVQYGAAAAKVRALYGRMLRPAEWESLGAFQSLADVSAFIRSHPGWREAAELIPPGCRDEQVLERAMHVQLESEYERIYKFAAREDKRFLLLSVYRTEYRRILSALRRVLARRGPETESAQERGFVAEKTKVHRKALSAAATLEDIIRAAEDTIYADVLKTVPLDEHTGIPDYARAQVLLENRFYSAAWRYLQKEHRGTAKAELCEMFGREADYLNLTHIMRLRRSFPGSLGSLNDLLIPIRWKLTDEYISRLASAATDEEALALLRASRWGPLFQDESLTASEHSYERGLEAFCRRSIHAQKPSVLVPQAYLTLKGIECGKLMRAAEAAKYGISPGRVL